MVKVLTGFDETIHQRHIADLIIITDFENQNLREFIPTAQEILAEFGPTFILFVLMASK